MNLSKFSVDLTKIISLPARYFSKDYYSAIPKHVTATLIGAATPVGRMTSLLLKQNRYIDELRLYDKTEDACGVALDLSHIDTNTKVKGYAGLQVLPEAIKDAHIVLVCSGKQKTSIEETQVELFEKNAPKLKDIATYVAEFNPKAVLCIATPPINALVPLVSEEYKRAKVYDPRKIIGITTLATSRANTFIASKLDVNADTVVCPVIGGFCSHTIVPVLSQATPCQIPHCDCQELQENIRFAEDDALELYKHDHGLVLSPAFAIARFATALAKAIKGDNKSVVCCYVRQTGHIGEFLKYMTSIVKLGRHGVDSAHMPKISGEECVQLQEAAEYIRRSIKLGEGYITGEIIDVKKMVIESKKSCDVIKVTKGESDEKGDSSSKKEKSSKIEKAFQKEPPKAKSLYSR